MQDEEKTIDVGEADEQAQEIDLDAPAPEQSLEEEQVDVEQVSEDNSQPANASAESAEQGNVQKDELNEYSEGVNKRIAKLKGKKKKLLHTHKVFNNKFKHKSNSTINLAANTQKS